MQITHEMQHKTCLKCNLSPAPFLEAAAVLVDVSYPDETMEGGAHFFATCILLSRDHSLLHSEVAHTFP